MGARNRLRRLWAALNLPPDVFAAKLELSLRRSKRAFEGKPTVGMLAKVVRAFPDVNAHWLLSGEGEMFTPHRERHLQLVADQATASNSGNTMGSHNTLQIINHACTCATIYQAQLQDKERLIQILLKQQP
jgi:hypothetical protein